MKNITRLILLTFTLVIVSACTPRYQTTYTFQPPHTSNGEICVEQCLSSKQRCERKCDVNNKQCSCDTDYRACYSLCGGRPIAHRRCIANCRRF